MRAITGAVIGAFTSAVFLGGAVAVATIPDSNTNVITGCYKKSSGVLRVIDKQAGQACSHTEAEVNWNQQGQQGVPGVPGAAGPAGPEGPQGEPGTSSGFGSVYSAAMMTVTGEGCPAGQARVVPTEEWGAPGIINAATCRIVGGEISVGFDVTFSIPASATRLFGSDERIQTNAGPPRVRSNGLSVYFICQDMSFKHPYPGGYIRCDFEINGNFAPTAADVAEILAAGYQSGPVVIYKLP